MVEGECERTQFKRFTSEKENIKKKKKKDLFIKLFFTFFAPKSGVVVPDLSAALRKNATVSAVDFSFFLPVIFEI